jgi:hypothetical protein
MGRVRSIQGSYEKYAHKVYEEISEKNAMENVDVHKRRGVWTGLIWLGMGSSGRLSLVINFGVT